MEKATEDLRETMKGEGQGIKNSEASSCYFEVVDLKRGWDEDKYYRNFKVNGDKSRKLMLNGFLVEFI